MAYSILHGNWIPPAPGGTFTLGAISPTRSSIWVPDTTTTAPAGPPDGASAPGGATATAGPAVTSGTLSTGQALGIAEGSSAKGLKTSGAATGSLMLSTPKGKISP